MTNVVCREIQYSGALKKLQDMTEEPHDHMKLEMLSQNQSLIHYRQLKERLQSQKFTTTNIKRKNNIMKQHQTLNTRFQELIASAGIPRLGTLLQVCHNKGMGIQSIIGRINDALNYKYKLKKCGEDECDIGYLVLCIGGPRLLTCFAFYPWVAISKVSSSSYFSAGVC